MGRASPRSQGILLTCVAQKSLPLRREGKWMHYKVVTPNHAGAARILSETLSTLSEDKTMQADLSRLTKVCCAPKQSAGT